MLAAKYITMRYVILYIYTVIAENFFYFKQLPLKYLVLIYNY